ncbi:MAG: thioesterase family protein [Acidobacteriota bacterium]|nr:thioesterase family protein [Acidobacteriota bacterium]
MVHFSNFFRYMEEAEHALWRAAGMTISPASGLYGVAGSAADPPGWPRIAATCDFKTPLHFEDDFEVLVRIEAVSARTIKYAHEIVRGSEAICTGTVTAVCVRRDVNGAVKAVAVPPDVLQRLRAVLQAP